MMSCVAFLTGCESLQSTGNYIQQQDIQLKKQLGLYPAD